MEEACSQRGRSPPGSKHPRTFLLPYLKQELAACSRKRAPHPPPSSRHMFSTSMCHIQKLGATQETENIKESSTNISLSYSPRATVEEVAQVRARVSSCRICDGQSGIWTDFSPSPSVFPVSIIPLLLHIQSCIVGQRVR
jgi:hypothetical protein